MITLSSLWFFTFVLIAIGFIWDFMFGYKSDMNINQAWGMFTLSMFCTVLAWANKGKGRYVIYEKDTDKSS